MLREGWSRSCHDWVFNWCLECVRNQL